MNELLSELLSPRTKFYVFLFASYLIRTSRVRCSRANKPIPLAEYITPPGSLFKKILPFLHGYLVLSNISYTLTALFCTCFNSQILSKSKEENYYFRCVMPKFVLTKHLNPENSLNLAWLLSLVHLSYRFLVINYHRQLEIDMISFLATKEEDVELALKLSRNGKQSHIKDENEQSSNNKGSECSLLKVMYYEFSDPTLSGHNESMEFLLRPNRTREARVKLFHLTSCLYNVTFMSSFIIILTTISISILTQLIEKEFIYPNCSIETSFTARLLFIWTMSSSIALNIIFQIDSIGGLLSSILFLRVLIEDLNLYWSNIMDQINRLTRQLTIELQIQHLDRLRYITRPSQIWCPYLAPNKSATHNNNNSNNIDDFIGYGASGDDCGHYTANHYVLFEQYNQRIVRDLAKLRTSLFDFFQLVNRTDVYVSLFITFIMFIWLASNALFTASGLQLETQTIDSKAIRVIQLLMFIMTLAVSSLVLNFRRKIELAYVPLCNIMAMDMSLDKNKWIQVLWFFNSGKAHYAFTLLRFKMFSKLTYLSIISYTITFALLMESFKDVKTI